ncbi:MAG: carbohydrate kinase family protein [Planctomycetales bacterium]
MAPRKTPQPFPTRPPWTPDALSPSPDIAVVGDVMVEYILEKGDFPQLGTTRIIDDVQVEIGGPPINVLWHLTHLGRSPRLVACVGARDQAVLQQQLPEIDWSRQSLLNRHDWTDTLIEFRDSAERFRALYVRVDPGAGIHDALQDEIGAPDCLILNGSRHAFLRTGFCQFIREARRRKRHCLIAFNPSYAIATYSSKELMDLLALADVTILNRKEVACTLRFAGGTTRRKLSDSIPGILIATDEDRGAVIWNGGKKTVVPSLSGLCGDFLGAGDGFFSGYLHQHLNRDTPLAASEFAARFAALVVRSQKIRPKVTTTAALRYKPPSPRP